MTWKEAEKHMEDGGFCCRKGTETTYRIHDEKLQLFNTYTNGWDDAINGYNAVKNERWLPTSDPVSAPPPQHTVPGVLVEILNIMEWLTTDKGTLRHLKALRQKVENMPNG
jgi:hypothetical protein